MPTVPKTDPETIVKKARALVKRGGIDALTMESLAKACGVRASSLYGHFPNRSAIVTALATQAMKEAEASVRQALSAPSRAEPLLTLAQALRRFAHTHTPLYRLLFSTPIAMSTDFAAASTSAVAFICEHVAEVSHREAADPEVLEGARLLTAFTHGFVDMELAGAFRQGGDIEQAFTRGVAAIVSTLAAAQRPL